MSFREMLVVAAIVVFILYRKHAMTVGTTTASPGVAQGTTIPNTPTGSASAGNGTVTGPVAHGGPKRPVNTLSGNYDS
jgi:hypothetical protein